MSFLACVCLLCIGLRCDARRLKIQYDASYELGWYELAERMPLIKNVYSSEEVGHVEKGQRVQVVEVLEVKESRVIWGRIEEPFDGWFSIVHEATHREYAHHVDSGSDYSCEIRKQSPWFCAMKADAMKWHCINDKLKGEKPVGVARLKFKKQGECYLQYAYGASTEAEAQQKVMSCCEKSRSELEDPKNPTKDCKLVGPALSDGFEKKCNFRLGKKTWMKDKCYCPAERPHALRHGSSITWHTPGDTELYIGIEEQVVCIDDCTARSLDPSPAPKTNLNREAWPVVFLAVYKLGVGIVHSNLAFCPDASIVKSRDACLQPGAAGCSASHHTSAFATGNDVPRLLMEHGCRELVFDGNEGGGLWTPSEHETGCWAQGIDAQDFWWDGGDGGNFRSGIGYQKLFWLSSDNSVRPFADQESEFTHGALERSGRGQSATGQTSLEMRMKKCFSDKLGKRIDFNRGSYNVLHHNCNKFSSEAMRELNLPLFAKAADKGHHSEISFSATTEESALRRGFHKVVSYFDKERSSVSTTCQKEVFGADLNCRRIGWGGRKGDCPVSIYSDEPLRCYDPNLRSSEPTAGLSIAVEYNERVNGVCGVPAGKRCDLRRHLDVPPCQPGFHCASVEVTTKVKVKAADGKTDIFQNKTETQNLCTMDDDCAKAVTGATMRQGDNPLTGAWCKCPRETTVKCGENVLDRHFNPDRMKGTCSCEKTK